jgi:hypothetical protein
MNRARGLAGAAGDIASDVDDVTVCVSARVRSGLLPVVGPLPALDKALRLARAIALVLWLSAMIFPV